MNRKKALNNLSKLGKDINLNNIENLINEIFNELDNEICKNCKYYSNGICNHIEIDDEEYPHNNAVLVGIKVELNDDTGSDINLRVNENFGCKCFKNK